MAGKPISTRCKYIVTENGNYEQRQSCGDGYCAKKCAEVSIACKRFHKYTYIFVVNSNLLYVLYSGFFLWLSINTDTAPTSNGWPCPTRISVPALPASRLPMTTARLKRASPVLTAYYSIPPASAPQAPALA